MTPEIALQTAIVALLEASSSLTSLLGSTKIFDQVPADADRPTPPYVYLGPVNTQRLELGECGEGQTIRARIFAVSTDFGRLEAWEVAHQVRLALNGAVPTLAGDFQISDAIIVTQAGDVIEPENPKSVFIDVAATVAATA